MRIGQNSWQKFRLILVGSAIGLFSLNLACSSESENKRGLAAAKRDPSLDSQAEGGLQGGGPLINFATVALIEAKNNEALTPDFKKKIILVSKVSSSQIMLFSNEGKSWVYNPSADAPPTALEPPVIQPLGLNVYTLPDGKFWLVGSQTIGRRKNADSTTGAVPVESFNTTTIQGDWSKARVLYAAVDTLILHLDTHIAILAIRNGAPALSQFSSKIPVPLDGPIVSAGETEAGGYWFASKGTVALLETSGLTLAWSRAKLPLDGHEDYSQLAMRLDSNNKAVSGDMLLFQADKFWSISGAAIQ